MKNGLLKNQTRGGEVVAQRLLLCHGFWNRLKGLLGTQTLEPDTACWLIPCNSIHTVGMQYPIDVYFLNRKNEILSVIENMSPCRFSPLVLKAHSVLEFKSGPRRNIRVGDVLKWEGSCA